MSDDTVVSILEAELEMGRELAHTLECQRQAIIDRDIARLDELTGILEGQFGRFNELLTARVGAKDTSPRIDDRRAELERQAMHVEARVVSLARLNHELLADRLAGFAPLVAALALNHSPLAYRAVGERAQAARRRLA